MGKMIVNYSAGVHKDVFGFYMEKAQGSSASDFIAGRSSSDDGLTAAEIKKLPPPRLDESRPKSSASSTTCNGSTSCLAKWTDTN